MGGWRKVGVRRVGVRRVGGPTQKKWGPEGWEPEGWGPEGWGPEGRGPEGWVGCDTVQADHAPDNGVIHGVLIRHHGRNQEEVEEGLGQEVKGQEEENAQETTKCTCMDGMR